MNQNALCLVMVTVPNRDEAEKIGNLLLSKRLVACVSKTAEVESTFHWRGALDKAEEVLLIMKTRPALLEKIEAEVVSAHSYEVPEIIALPIIGAHGPYANWVEQETT